MGPPRKKLRRSEPVPPRENPPQEAKTILRRQAADAGRQIAPRREEGIAARCVRRVTARTVVSDYLGGAAFSAALVLAGTMMAPPSCFNSTCRLKFEAGLGMEVAMSFSAPFWAWTP